MIQEALAGLEPFVLHFGAATILIILGGFGMWFIPSVKAKIVLGGLILTVIATVVAYVVGVKNEAHRNSLQQAVIQSRVETAVKKALHPHVIRHRSCGVRDPWDRDWKD